MAIAPVIRLFPDKEEKQVFQQGAVVIPILDEEDNIAGLIHGVENQAKARDSAGLHHMAELFGHELTVIFVDDSRHTKCADEVVKVREELARCGCGYITIEYIHRTGANRKGGLSGAVTDGAKKARELGLNKVIVMDGDLQHKPWYVPELLHALGSNGGVNLVATTRYAGAGSSEGLDGIHRHFVSRASTLLAKMLFPRRLRLITDPMSGMFGFHVHAVNLTRLNPRGFKILVEILLTHPTIRRTEREITFGSRAHGESKGDLRQGLTFLRQLLWHRLVK